MLSLKHKILNFIFKNVKIDHIAIDAARTFKFEHLNLINLLKFIN